MTELADYMKLLWPHLATLHCRQCGEPVKKESPSDVWNAECRGRSTESATRAELLVTFDLPLSEKLSLSESLTLVANQGYQRLLVNGAVMRIVDALSDSAFRTPRSALTVVQDRVKLAPENRSRFVEACEQAFHFGKGKLTIFAINSRGLPCDPRFFSNRYHCATCDIDYREPIPALFSFNHPLGASGVPRLRARHHNRLRRGDSRPLENAAAGIRPCRSGTV